MAMDIADVRHFQSLFEVAPDGDPVFEQLLKLLTACPGSGEQVHDANLVTTMIVSVVNRSLISMRGIFSVLLRQLSSSRSFHHDVALTFA